LKETKMDNSPEKCMQTKVLRELKEQRKEDRKEAWAIVLALTILIGTTFLISYVILAPDRFKIMDKQKGKIIVEYDGSHYILKKVERKQTVNDRWREIKKEHP